MSRIVCALTTCAGLVAMGPFAQAVPVIGVNLIANPNAEADVGSFDGYAVVSVTAWTTVGTATLASYNAPGGFPTSTDPGPPDRGSNFFAGGNDNTTSALLQSIDVTGAGGSPFAMEGWFGGFDEHRDNAALTAEFIDAGNTSLGSATIGAVLLSDRPFGTGFLLSATVGMLPLETSRIDFSIDFVRFDGAYNDGYADNLSFELTGQPIPEPTSFVLVAVAGGVVVVVRVHGSRRRLA